MSTFLHYLMTNDYQRLQELEQIERQANTSDARARGADGRLYELSSTVYQLAATVRVLARALADAKLLDLAKLEAAVKDEMRHPHSASGERIASKCVRCSKAGFVDEMVKVGADVWCHDCARHP
jgi:hypothetical protein|nr:hypothetical protein [Kofleriaceae bacterium]